MKNWMEQRHLLSLTAELHYNRICSFLRHRLVASGPKCSSTVFLLSFRDKLVILGAMLFTWSRFPRLPAVDRLVHADSSQVLKCYQLCHRRETSCDEGSADWSNDFCGSIGCLVSTRSTGSGYYLVYSSKAIFLIYLYKDFIQLWLYLRASSSGL